MKTYIRSESRFLPTTPAFDDPVGPRQNIAMMLGTEKIMMWLAGGKKNKDVFIRFDRIHEHDGHTDRQTGRQTDKRMDGHRMTA